MSASLKRALKVYRLHAGGCNNCDIEILALLIPRFDAERKLGIEIVHSPEDANVLVVTGPVTKQIKNMVLEVYEQVPEPKAVVVVGTCGLSGGVFGGGGVENYAIAGPIHKFIPVDVHVPGCPPKPEAIMRGIALAIQKLAEKVAAKRNSAKEASLG